MWLHRIQWVNNVRVLSQDIEAISPVVTWSQRRRRTGCRRILQIYHSITSSSDCSASAPAPSSDPVWRTCRRSVIELYQYCIRMILNRCLVEYRLIAAGSLQPGCYRFGFHAIPSLDQLHMHLIVSIVIPIAAGIEYLGV